MQQRECDAMDCWYKQVPYKPGTMVSVVANCLSDLAIVESHTLLTMADTVTVPFDISLCNVCSYSLPLRNTMICAICTSHMCAPWLTLVGKYRTRLYCHVCIDETDCVNMETALQFFIANDPNRVITRSCNHALYREARRYIKLVERLTLGEYNLIPRVVTRK